MRRTTFLSFFSKHISNISWSIQWLLMSHWQTPTSGVTGAGLMPFSWNNCWPMSATPSQTREMFCNSVLSPNIWTILTEVSPFPTHPAVVQLNVLGALARFRPGESFGVCPPLDINQESTEVTPPPHTAEKQGSEWRAFCGKYLFSTFLCPRFDRFLWFPNLGPK